MFPRLADIVLTIALGACCWISCGVATAASFESNPDVAQFIDELVLDHQFNRSKLQSWFSRARLQSSVLKAIANPATARPWHEYRAHNVTEARVRGGLEYWQRHADALVRARAEYGIPEELIVATIGMETHYGRVMGNNPVFDTLATLAFSYPQRTELFRGELLQLLLLARDTGSDPLRYRGSFAGALGVAQFLPSSYRKYAVDFNRDGKRDLWNHTDAIGSIANYYRAHGWQLGEHVVVALEQPLDPGSDEFKLLLGAGLSPHTPVAAIRRAGASPVEAISDDALASIVAAESASGTRYWIGLNNFYVITRYNRSINYALAVHELSQELRRAREGIAEATPP